MMSKCPGAHSNAFNLAFLHAQIQFLREALPNPDEPGLPLTTRIQRLKAVKQEALMKKKETAKLLKAASKKLKKVKSALSQLSDQDLAQAVAERTAAAKAKAKAAAAHP